MALRYCNSLGNTLIILALVLGGRLGSLDSRLAMSAARLISRRNASMALRRASAAGSWPRRPLRILSALSLFDSLARLLNVARDIDGEGDVDEAGVVVVRVVSVEAVDGVELDLVLLDLRNIISM